MGVRDVYVRNEQINGTMDIDLMIESLFLHLAKVTGYVERDQDREIYGI